MPEGKVLFTDLDDTLLSDDKTVSPKNKAAIQEALSRGHSVVVTTGRPVKSGKNVVKELGLTAPGCYMIAFNGSVRGGSDFKTENGAACCCQNPV